MVKELFSLYLQTTISGTILIAAILLARLFLRRAPRRILCIVWLLALLRLLVPFQIESFLSLQPEQPNFSTAMQTESVAPAASAPVILPQTQTVAPPQAHIQNEVPAPEPTRSVDYAQIISVVWCVVTCGFVLYGIVSYLIFKIKVGNVIVQPNGIKECAAINNAFLVGLFRPVIYLPADLSPRERELILAHEQTHIVHGDNWWKILGFLCLCLHWYNPAVWICFHVFNKDIEIACDEKVVRNLDAASRKTYSLALLRFSQKNSVPYLPSSSFAKINLKERIRCILSYKKPRFWITGVAVLLTVVIAVCFLTYPGQKEQEMQSADPTVPVQTQPEAVPDSTRDITPTVSTDPVQETTIATEPPATEPPATEPPATEPPATEPPATEPPVTEPPIVDHPVTDQISTPDAVTPNIYNFNLEAIDLNATNYAASLGFQTLDDHPNVNVAYFRAPILNMDYITEEALQESAYEAVNAAYKYCCVYNRFDVSSTVVWVTVSYDLCYMIAVYCAI